MRLVAVCLWLVPMLGWACTVAPDRAFLEAPNLRVAIEERFASREWLTVYQWATMAEGDDRTFRLPMPERRRIREMKALAAIRIGRSTEAIEQLKALIGERRDAMLEARLLEAELTHAELVDVLEEGAVNAALRRLRDGQADVELQVALVPQLRRMKRTELMASVCRDLEDLDPPNADAKRVCSGAPQLPKRTPPRQLGGCS
jgi:hypothetical protein